MLMKKVFIILTSLLCTVLIIYCISSMNERAEINVSVTSEKMIAEDNIKDVPKTSTIGLNVFKTPSKYTYDYLIQDIKQLQSAYSEKIIVKSICDTADNRKVYDIVIGNLDGKKQILIFGAMHAREYITSQVVMRQLCDAIDALNEHNKTYKGVPLDELMNDVTIHFIPMSNPDGVSISQEGFGAIRNTEIRNQILTLGGDYEQWKSNSMGVDLNRNFDAGWIEYGGPSAPAPERYKGKFPGSEPESAALISLTEKNNICRSISYHTCGALIYWYYKQDGEVLEKSRNFANIISEETNYPLDFDYTAVDAAGYKDWAVYRKGIPSLTIEIGAENSAPLVNPVPISRWDEIWKRNKNVLYATIYNLKNE